MLPEPPGLAHGYMQGSDDGCMQVWQTLQGEWAEMTGMRESNSTREEVKAREELLVEKSVSFFNEFVKGAMRDSSPSPQEEEKEKKIERRKKVQKRCAHPHGCLRQPSFGCSKDRIPKFCQAHKPANFVHVKNSSCRFKACSKQPTFGRPESTIAEFCSQHKLEGYVDLKHRRCEKCSRQPSYGGKDEVALRCSMHKKVEDLDKKHKKAKKTPA